MIDEIIAVGDPAHVAHHVALAQATNSSKATKYPERYGALGDGVNDDTGPINAALADLQTGETLYFESGKTYLHSGELTVTVDGVTLRGGGTLLATTPDNACVRVDADDVTVEGLTLKLKPVAQTTLSGSLTSGTTAVVLASDAGFPVGTGWTILVDPETASAERMLVTARTGPNLTVTRAQNNSTAKAHADGAVVVRATRQSDSEAHLLYSNGHSGMRVRNVIFHSSDASASLLEACSNYSFEGCKVYGGLADSFHNTHGSHDGFYRNCEAWYGGDDSYAVIGYEGQGKPSNITFESCKSVGGFARGFAVVGADDVVVRDGYVEGSAAAAFYVACEDSFTSYSTSGVLVEGSTAVGCNVKYASLDHGSAIVYNGRGGAYAVDDVIFRSCTMRNTPGGSREISVIGYNTPIITNLRFEQIDVINSVPGTLIGGNVSLATTYQDIRDITGYAPPSGVSGEWTLVGKNSGTTTASLAVTCSAVGATQYKVVIQAQNTSVADIPAIQFNGDTGANYTYRHMTVGSTGTTLTDVQAGNATSAQLSGVSRVGERVIEINIQRDTLNSTGTVTAAASNRSKSTVTGTWDMCGQINWYPGNYSEITSVTVFTVGGATFNKIRVWVYAILP